MGGIQRRIGSEPLSRRFRRGDSDDVLLVVMEDGETVERR